MAFLSTIISGTCLRATENQAKPKSAKSHKVVASTKIPSSSISQEVISIISSQLVSVFQSWEYLKFLSSCFHKSIQWISCLISKTCSWQKIQVRIALNPSYPYQTSKPRSHRWPPSTMETITKQFQQWNKSPIAEAYRINTCLLHSFSCVKFEISSPIADASVRLKLSTYHLQSIKSI